MESLTQDLIETSNAIEAEILAKSRQFKSEMDARQWLHKELSQLAHTELEAGSVAHREAWLKRVYANMRLHYVAQVGGKEVMHIHNALPFSQGAEIDVLDILAEKTAWDRVCVIGSGTYELLILRLRAMAIMGITFETSPDEYVTRFCTGYGKFGNPTAAVNAKGNWLPLLLSIQTALKANPIVKKAAVKLELKVGDQVVALPKHMMRRPASQASRERIISFSAVLGLLIVGGAVLWGGPTLKRIGQSPVTMPSTSKALAATPQPSSLITKVAPSVAPQEQVGFYVIGVAAREEASAQAEVQQRRQEGLQPRVVYSSHWSGLTPNYYLVVYHVFANRADTVGVRKNLEKRGIKTYVMHSGQRLRP